MRSVTVKLADREYIVNELKARQNQEWRALLKGKFTDIADLINSAPKTELTSDSISILIRSMSTAIMDSVDDVRGLLLAYSSKLDDDHEYIEENAYDSEIMTAFVEVLTLAFPFGGLFRRVSQVLETGPTAKLT